MRHYDYVIIGGGMAADAAAHGIRERDKHGTICVISADAHLPYNRPPLSKGLWKGEAFSTIVRPNGDDRREVHLGRHARVLDRASHVVTDDRGEQYGYRKLLLATGGEPRKLKGAPDDVIYFRTLDDYRRTRELSDLGATFGVIGGGFIGSEVAAALRMHERNVTMIVPENGLCSRSLPADISAYVANYYRDKGIVVRLNDSVEAIEERGPGFVIRTKETVVEVDAIIAGIGIVPSVDLAAQAGLPVENGIIVDEELRTADSDIYAAGDVANFFNATLGRRMRFEHEDNANSMGAVAGNNMAGGNKAYEHVPFFYSDLFDLGYEAVGTLDAGLETFADWTTPFREGVVYYLDGGRVRGVLLWNTWGQLDNARALLAEPGPFSATNLKGRLPA
jgi:3-phenylpropionate/trans-cinnamate dioxygenase ferredoxin reductase component